MTDVAILKKAGVYDVENAYHSIDECRIQYE
jgi:hypothetical protein